MGWLGYKATAQIQNNIGHDDLKKKNNKKWERDQVCPITGTRHKVSKIYIVIHAEKHFCNRLRLKIGESCIFSDNSIPC